MGNLREMCFRRWSVLVAAVALVVFLAVSGCRGATPAGPDTAPGFSAVVADQIFTLGEAVSLVLPEASGGNGALSYTLEPEVPGLTFDDVSRTLSGVPTVPDTYSMTYTVVDGDDNTEDSDTTTLNFTITVEPDTAPSFAEKVEDRSISAGDDVSVTLPAASGGNGALAYVLEPEVPGLTFDSEARTLSGTPTTPATYEMTYTVSDSDNNLEDSDAAALAFAIMIEAPEGVLSVYGGSGDEVFALNAGGEPLDNALYTLVLGEAAAELYLIATNTTAGETDPMITIVSGVEAATTASPRVTGVGHLSASDPSNYPPQWVTEFNNNPRRLQRVAALRQSPSEPMESKQPVAEGDTFAFYHFLDVETPVQVPATARRVVTDGTITAALWVADEVWGTCSECVSQEMVDALADRFLQAGGDNDLYDWVTAIFGEPWGPHDYSELIPEEDANEIHMLLLAIEESGGYYNSINNVLSVPGDPTNERLMFYVDIESFVHPDGPSWEITDPGPAWTVSTLAHEFQHMINYYQKMVRHEFQAYSPAWINEMASVVTEDFVAEKIMSSGRRGVAYDDPTAGGPENRGDLAAYNYFNHLQGAYFEFDAPLFRYYATNYALGAYLARTYGGAPLFTAMVQNDQTGIDALEAALADQGHSVSFEQVLVDWAVANLLSDDTQAPHPYRYNSGTWSISVAGGVTFRLGSINLFTYRYFYGDGPNDYHDGPYFFSVPEFNGFGAQPPHSNRYADLGRGTGTVRLRIDATTGNRITVVVKE